MRKAQLATGALALVGALVVAMPSSQSVTPGWQVLPTPGVSYSAVSCLAPAACIAVSGNGNDPAISWNGSAWSTRPTPAGSGRHQYFLNGVSCTSTTACAAVGEDSACPLDGPANCSPPLRAPLAERWNGVRWAKQSVLLSYHDALFNGVSCVSANRCVAVGVDFLQSATSSSSRVIIARWNGLAWLAQSAPSPAKFSGLSAVSCTAVSSCTAVGWTSDGFYDAALAERWDGKAWTVQPTPSRIGTSTAQLTAVSCPAPTMCIASGDSTVASAEVPLIERWDGSGWRLEATPPSIGALRLLTGVSCASTTQCMAVGWARATPFGDYPFVEQWDGTVWALDNAVGFGPSQLDAVSCPTATSCMAVGVWQPAAGLSEQWTG